jgi:phosphohistidine phosphatase
MEILIIRHGQAVDDAPDLGDGGRWLTGKGRKVTRRVATWLAKRDERRPAALWTSPLVRAVQTAEIVAEAAGLTDEVAAVAELSPGHEPAEIIRRLSLYGGPGPLGLVGHEPLLSMVAASLLGAGGADGEPSLHLKKSGVIGIVWDGRGRATLRFLLDPKEMRVAKELRDDDEAPRSKPKGSAG